MRLFRWFFTSVKSTSSFLISFLLFIQLLFFFLPCRNSLVVVVSFNKDETRCEISQIPRLTPQLYFMARKLMWDTKQEKEKKVLLSKIENCRLALSLSEGIFLLLLQDNKKPKKNKWTFRVIHLNCTLLLHHFASKIVRLLSRKFSWKLPIQK